MRSASCSSIKSPLTPVWRYATEAAAAMVAYAFAQLRLRRIVATTEHDNTRSINVLRRLGMRIERNPRPEPTWFQTVGILDNAS